MDIRMTSRLKVALLALSASSAWLLGPATTARADFFNFNPTGSAPGGTTYTNISGLGFAPGNAVGVGAIPLAVGKTFQLYYQTHLTSLTGPNAPGNIPNLNAAGPNGFQITEVATLSETVTGLIPTPSGFQATFALNPAGANQIKIFYNPAKVYDDAAGTGFAVGQVIATLTPTSFTSSQFTDATAGGLTPPAKFNQTGAGNTTTATADVGEGVSGLMNNVNSFDKAFFNPPTGLPSLSGSLFRSNLSSTFDAISPSLLFTNPLGGTVVPNPGANNGTSGPDFQLQASGFTQSFTVVPEPASMTLIGLGLTGVVAYSRRKRSGDV